MTDRTPCPGSGEAARNGGFPVITDSLNVMLRIAWCAGCQHRVLVIDGHMIEHYRPAAPAPVVDPQPEQPAVPAKRTTLREQLLANRVPR